MGQAVLEGRPFRVDPHSVSWDFSVSVSDEKTIGGKVVQVFGAKLGDIHLSGAFGIGGWEEQQQFLQRIKALGEEQLDNWPFPNREPFRFVWPQRGWDFKVWIRDFTEESASVDMSVENFNPKWNLVLFPVEDNAALTVVSENAYIERLMAGIGWRQTEFNGPMGEVELQAALTSQGVSTIREYLSVGYGLASPLSPAGTTDAATPAPAGGASTAVATTEVQKYVQQQAAARGWTGAEWDALFELIRRESSWNPSADNPSSTAEGLFQKLQSVHGRVEPTYQGQTTWGLNYIAGRYGTPSKALAFHNRNNHY